MNGHRTGSGEQVLYSDCTSEVNSIFLAAFSVTAARAAVTENAAVGPQARSSHSRQLRAPKDATRNTNK